MPEPQSKNIEPDASTAQTRLEFLTTDELLGEVFRRHVEGIFIGRSFSNPDGYSIRGVGSPVQNWGLLRVLKKYIEKRMPE